MPKKQRKITAEKTNTHLPLEPVVINLNVNLVVNEETTTGRIS